MVSYMITDGNGSYIRKDGFSNKYVPVRSQSLADKWESRYKADNVLNNMVCKSVRKKYRVLEIEESDHVANEKESVKPNEKFVKHIIDEEVEDEQISKWSDEINHLKDFVLDAENRKTELSDMLSQVDREISDINHYIEFGVLNAYQGWLAFNMLRSRLRKRRKVKDELQILCQLGECKINSSMLTDIRNTIDKMGNREYTPRVLTELFQ